jgi:hypothetical protein
MITTAKNKNELIAGLKQQKDFAVLAGCGCVDDFQYVYFRTQGKRSSI